MEISEFASELLFANTLQGKLSFRDEKISDLKPKINWVMPDFPGRPKELLPKSSNSKRNKSQNKFPSLNDLDSDTWARGRVLHFFANHELLALEIMALALLKFPNAHPQFRLSLVHTIREEQKHMLFYLDRMSDFGIGFGEISVSDFFWKCCKDHDDPAQFLSAISLTFEQANLDYCLHYKNAFLKIGDQKTADALDKVYVDEIGHVKNGVYWMNEWKKDTESLWSFYTRKLNWPLTPERAKGNVFDTKGRLAAGLDQDFQDSLRYFAHSKGKVPDVWSFLPGSEWEASGKKKPKATISIQHDLGSLLLWVVGPDDVVVSDEPPSNDFLNILLQFSNRLPQTLLKKNKEVWKERQVGALYPWSWTANVESDFKSLLETSTSWQQDRVKKMSSDYSYGLHRSRSVELEGVLSDKVEHEDLLFTQGVVCSADFIETLNSKELSAGMVAKNVYSSSGHGIFFFSSKDEFANCPFRNEPEILFEKRLSRVVDLSFLYDATPAGLYFNKAITQFHTTTKGTYKSHIVGRYSYGLDQKVLRLLHTQYNGKSLIRNAHDAIRDLLPQVWPAYRGPVGVDAMVVDIGGRLYLRPVVEVNFRQTMGHYSHALRKVLAPGKDGLFLIRPNKKFEAKNYTVNNNKLESGELPLTDLQTSKRFCATLSVLD